MPDVKWKACADFEFLWQEIDSGYLVYHSGSSDTHLLNSVAKQIVDILKNEILSTDQLQERLISFQSKLEQENCPDLEEVLSHLKKIHFIEAVQR